MASVAVKWLINQSFAALRSIAHFVQPLCAGISARQYVLYHCEAWSIYIAAMSQMWLSTPVCHKYRSAKLKGVLSGIKMNTNAYAYGTQKVLKCPKSVFLLFKKCRKAFDWNLRKGTVFMPDLGSSSPSQWYFRIMSISAGSKNNVLYAVKILRLFGAHIWLLLLPALKMHFKTFYERKDFWMPMTSWVVPWFSVSWNCSWQQFYLFCRHKKWAATPRGCNQERCCYAQAPHWIKSGRQCKDAREHNLAGPELGTGSRRVGLSADC